MAMQYNTIAATNDYTKSDGVKDAPQVVTDAPPYLPPLPNDITTINYLPDKVIGNETETESLDQIQEIEYAVKPEKVVGNETETISKKSNLGLIIGASVGGMLVLLIVLYLVYFRKN